MAAIIEMLQESQESIDSDFNLLAPGYEVHYATRPVGIYTVLVIKRGDEGEILNLTEVTGYWTIPNFHTGKSTWQRSIQRIKATRDGQLRWRGILSGNGLSDTYNQLDGKKRFVDMDDEEKGAYLDYKYALALMRN